MVITTIKHVKVLPVKYTIHLHHNILPGAPFDECLTPRTKLNNKLGLFSTNNKLLMHIPEKKIQSVKIKAKKVVYLINGGKPIKDRLRNCEGVSNSGFYNVKIPEPCPSYGNKMTKNTAKSGFFFLKKNNSITKGSFFF